MGQQTGRSHPAQTLCEIGSAGADTASAFLQAKEPNHPWPREPSKHADGAQLTGIAHFPELYGAQERTGSPPPKEPDLLGFFSRPVRLCVPAMCAVFKPVADGDRRSVGGPRHWPGRGCRTRVSSLPAAWDPSTSLPLASVDSILRPLRLSGKRNKLDDVRRYVATIEQSQAFIDQVFDKTIWLGDRTV